MSAKPYFMALRAFLLWVYPIITSTESTVYPLLRRLQKENYLESTWKDSAEGLPPRKYYSLTPVGKEYL